jgi:phosphate transport system permease protein
MVNKVKPKVFSSDFILRSLIYFFSGLTIAFLGWIIIFVLMKGLPHVSLGFLTTQYKGSNHGILPMIISTVYMILLSLAIATPIGIGSAIYLNEYAKQGRLVSIARFATESLAGIPSIIYGLFGFAFFVTALHMRFSILAGALTISILILPVIIRTTEEALKTVPMSYREGSLALGASKLETILRVILPSAIPGITVAIILSIGRVVGETAVLIFTAGTAIRGVNVDIFDPSRTIAVHLYMLAKEGMDPNEAYATAAVLIILVGGLNLIAQIISDRLKKKVNFE